MRRAIVRQENYRRAQLRAVQAADGRAWREADRGREQGVSIWRCNTCGEKSSDEALLHAPSPLDPQEDLVGCPHCRQVSEGFDEMCDEPGCGLLATCGWKPKGELYRRTCGKHMGEH